jgi:hypothetical protein
MGVQKTEVCKTKSLMNGLGSQLSEETMARRLGGARSRETRRI